MTNYDACLAFANFQSGHSNNVISDGNVIYSYGSHFPMAVRKDGKLYVNSDKYSPTTSKQQSYLRRALNEVGTTEWELKTTGELKNMI